MEKQIRKIRIKRIQTPKSKIWYQEKISYVSVAVVEWV